MPGRDLCRRFHATAVRPLLSGIPHAAALLGAGSEVLGFDDDVSPDHDFGPRCQVFVADDAVEAAKKALEDLPDEFEGLPVRHPHWGGPARHQVEVGTVAGYFRAQLGVDPADGLTLTDWLTSPTQRLVSLVDGEVFADPEGELESRRLTLRWYPDDVWRYALASAWLRIGQEEAFVGRTGAVGDDLGSAVVTARLARDLMRLAFLVERRWAPYSKWLGTAFARLPIAGRLTPHLGEALAAGDWRAREAALCEAGEILAAATNALGLAAPVEENARQYYTRDIRVVGGERFTGALVAAITDPEITGLLERLGSRADAVGRLPGTIDQAADSVDVLSSPERCRAAAAMLGVG
ncbi:DUF4037 domain-containing protein [Phytomonospora sp. NPDC050363]|uniref:DUF4037 domain-containing protein n=1 Tax=Phytomonospora sp. NPDC050363 TaxID=3155642 RepID=UPI0034078263